MTVNKCLIDGLHLPVFHEDEVENCVETGHHQIGEAQVDEEVVGHVLHPAMA